MRWLGILLGACVACGGEPAPSAPKASARTIDAAAAPTTSASTSDAAAAGRPSTSAAVNEEAAGAAAKRRCYPYQPRADGSCPDACATRDDCQGSHGPADLAVNGWPLDCIRRACVPLPPQRVRGRP